ncbi:MAG TPA: low temperature requirement protein A [Amycolatopsis sp.]|nr:low temperature requirement protein A [Amycolatopsis sp.]
MDDGEASPHGTARVGEHTGEESERHASWLELFFDLVAVAGVAVLSQQLHGAESASPFGIALVCFLAFWSAWMSFTVYGNIVGDGVLAIAVLLAMFGLAVMAASAPIEHGEHAGIFALAYVLVRALGARVWRGGRRESVLRIAQDWPVAQLTAGGLPWLVSLWFTGGWRYGLWAAGIGLDLLIIGIARGHHVTRHATRRAAGANRAPRIVATTVDAPHFGERLGLFILIVLGESVMTATEALAEVPDWTTGEYFTIAGAFALLAGLWAMALPRGFGGIPKLAADSVPVRALLLLHCATAAALVTLADSIAAVLRDPGEQAPAGTVRWLLCASVAAFTLIGMGADLTVRHRPARMILPGVAGVAAPLAVAVFGERLGAGVLLWLVAAMVAIDLAIDLATARRGGGTLSRGE